MYILVYKYFFCILHKCCLISENIGCIPGDWLISLSLMDSRWDRFVASGRISSFLTAMQYSTDQLCHSCFIHSSFSGYLYCFQESLIMVCCGEDYFWSILCGVLCPSCIWFPVSSFLSGKISCIISLSTFLSRTFLSVPTGTPSTLRFGLLMVSINSVGFS